MGHYLYASRKFLIIFKNVLLMKDVKNKSYPRKKLAIVISAIVLICFLQISINSYAESP
jgi:hypothetical protein